MAVCQYQGRSMIFACVVNGSFKSSHSNLHICKINVSLGTLNGIIASRIAQHANGLVERNEWTKVAFFIILKKLQKITPWA